MNPKNHTAALSEAAQAVARLRPAITELDAMSQEGFGAIEALTTVTLLALEAPAAYHRNAQLPELVAQVLTVIGNIAAQTRDAINSNAEARGCAHVDKPAERRSQAAEAAANETTGV